MAATESKNKKNKNGSFLNKVNRSIKDIRGEAKKIHWPTKEQLKNNTAVVLFMVLVAGVFVWGTDVLMALVTNFMIK